MEAEIRRKGLRLSICLSHTVVLPEAVIMGSAIIMVILDCRALIEPCSSDSTGSVPTTISHPRAMRSVISLGSMTRPTIYGSDPFCAPVHLQSRRRIGFVPFYAPLYLQLP
jgi:hypothetical protein